MTLASQLVKEVDYLQHATSHDLVDYSVVFFISRLLREQLVDSTPVFEGVKTHANELSSLVSLGSGFGLNAVWARLNVGQPSPSAMLGLAEMTNLALGCKYGA